MSRAMPLPPFFKQPFTGHFPGLTAARAARPRLCSFFYFPCRARCALLYLASAPLQRAGFSFPQTECRRRDQEDSFLPFPSFPSRGMTIYRIVRPAVFDNLSVSVHPSLPPLLFFLFYPAEEEGAKSGEFHPSFPDIL